MAHQSSADYSVTMRGLALCLRIDLRRLLRLEHRRPARLVDAAVRVALALTASSPAFRSKRIIVLSAPWPTSWSICEARRKTQEQLEDKVDTEAQTIRRAERWHH